MDFERQEGVLTDRNSTRSGSSRTFRYTVPNYSPRFVDLALSDLLPLRRLLVHGSVHKPICELRNTIKLFKSNVQGRIEGGLVGCQIFPSTLEHDTFQPTWSANRYIASTTYT